MSGSEYYRASGSGNDFLALVEPASEPAPALIRTWCRRGVSLGADGLFTLHRRPGGVVMRYYNGGDGEAADLCVNGTRCAAQLAFHLGWAGEEVEVVTGAGSLLARKLPGESVRLEVPLPRELPEEVEVEAAGRVWQGHFVTVGVPHLILPWSGSLAEAPVAEVGPILRRAPRFSHGANVSFTRRVVAHRLEIRTYERGVEAETLACGTGVLAAALVERFQEGDFPLTALTLGGFELEVSGDLTPGQPPGVGASGPWTGNWALEGDARILARGTMLPGLADLPAPARWS